MKSAYIKMHASIFLWGFTGILGKLILLNEGLLVWYRMLITSLLLGLFILITNQFQKVSFKKLMQISGVGFIVMLHWIFFYGAIKYSNVSITLSCLASSALFTSVFEPLLHRGKSKFILNYSEIFYSLLAGLGIYLIFAGQKEFGIGILLALIAAALGALFTVFNKKLMEDNQPEMVTFIEISSGLIFLTALMPLYMNLFPSDSLLPNSNDWMYLFLLSFFCTVIPFVMSLHALKKVSAFTINLSLNLEPVYGIILAFLVFGENKLLGRGFFYGTFMILLSVSLHTIHKLYDKRKQRLAAVNLK